MYMGALYAHVCGPHACSAHRGQLDHLELELQRVLSHYMLMLKIKSRSSEKTGQAVLAHAS